MELSDTQLENLEPFLMNAGLSCYNFCWLGAKRYKTVSDYIHKKALT